MIYLTDAQKGKRTEIDEEKMAIEGSDTEISDITYHDFDRPPHVPALLYFAVSVFLMFTAKTGYANNFEGVWYFLQTLYCVTFVFVVRSEYIQYRVKTNSGEIKACSDAHEYFKALNALQDKEKRDKGESIEKEYWGGRFPIPKNRYKSSDVK